MEQDICCSPLASAHTQACTPAPTHVQTPHTHTHTHTRACVHAHAHTHFLLREQTEQCGNDLNARAQHRLRKSQ